MTQHTRRAGSRSGGFSFVELLVTIIIAGIAFAAMVPLFVQAQQSGASAQHRSAAQNIAQDRIERLRQLPWSVVVDGVEEGGLTWGNVTVGGKAFTVQLLPVKVVNGTQKTVTVRVSWTAPPAATPRSLQLTTNIFRQLPGPQVTDVLFEPEPDPAAPSSGNWIRVIPISGAIVVRAVVNPAQALDCKRVKFTIVDMSGKLSPIVTYAETPDSGTDNRYSYTTWGLDAVGSPIGLHDGLYRVTAVAFSQDTGGATSLPGNTYVRDIRIETSVPAELNVTAYAGKVTPPVVNLIWDPSDAADWDHYQVWRRTASAGETDWTLIGDEIRSFGIQDLSVEADGPVYEYVVRAVDTADNALPLDQLTPVTAGPLSSGAAAAPGAPSGLSLRFSGANVIVSWAPPSPATGVVGYHVYRRELMTGTTSLVAVAASVATTTYTAYDRTISWETPYAYTVLAFNADGRESPVAGLAAGQSKDASDWATVTTPAAPIYELRITIQNVPNKGATVTITDAHTADALLSFNVTKSAPSASRQLPYGNYIVSAGGKSVSVNLTGDPSQPVYASLSL